MTSQCLCLPSPPHPPLLGPNARDLGCVALGSTYLTPQMKPQLPSQPSGLTMARPQGGGPICGGAWCPPTPSMAPSPMPLLASWSCAWEAEAQRGGDRLEVTPGVSSRSLLLGLVARP